MTSGRPSVSDGGEIGCGEAVGFGCNAPEGFSPAEHPLDGVATAGERGAEAALLTPVCLGRDVWHRAAGVIARLGAIRIDGAISDHRAAFRNCLDERLAAVEVGRGATSEVERDRLAGPVCRGVDLAGPPTARRAPSRPAAMGCATARWRARVPPFPARRLRCAFASVASSNTSRSRATGSRERLEDASPDAPDRPPDLSVVQRLRRAVLAQRMPPRTTRPQHLHDAADHTPVVHPRRAACLRWQKRRKAPNLRLAQPEQIAHPGSPNHRQGNHVDEHRPASLKK